ncbi:ABC transporter substrate-binding protein [Adhaeribacter rhizoryzae]|uniref:ABC transporter substrate-binding protein n=1 Tax=Adhaeribacter rhizoryzae TaxID=2607907 RepID=A0A5M6DPZ0_9BACT|nr:helical backbone metal receptor [Adhaeribacter rhizoryzae]KAA5549597.1 ABC transporter substrate-binding protein [Adhaeribacter rhizoryzae]
MSIITSVLNIRLFCSFLMFGTLLLNLACESKKASQSAAAFIIVTDDLGRKIQIPAYPQRVIALSPSATEMLYAVADEKTIVGRTQNCDYPERVKEKPVVNNYPMDYEKIVLLKPDIVFASAGITSLEVAAKLQDLNIPVYFQDFKKVTDVFRGLQDIGRLLHREKDAQRVVDSLQQELAQIKVNNAGPKLRVLAITWHDPIYVFGQNTLFTDKLRYLGAENSVTEVFAQPYPALTREYILKLNPDVLLGGTPAEMEKTFFAQYPELKKIKAYQQQKIFKPTDDLMSRPGPRVIESIRELKTFLVQ